MSLQADHSEYSLYEKATPFPVINTQGFQGESSRDLSVNNIHLGTGRPGTANGKESDTNVSAPIQNVASGSQTVGFMLPPGLRMASCREDNVQYPNLRPYHGISNLEDQRFNMSANDTLRQLYTVEPATTDRVNRRRQTPTEEEINSDLLRMGLLANTGTSDILDTTRRQLGTMNGFGPVINRPFHTSQFPGKLPDTDISFQPQGPANYNAVAFPQNAGLAPSPVSTGKKTQTEDSRLSIYQSNGFISGFNNAERQSLGAEWITGRPEGSRCTFAENGQIDPYIPDKNEVVPSKNARNPHSQQWNSVKNYNTPLLGLGIDHQGFPPTPSSNGRSSGEQFSPINNSEPYFPSCQMSNSSFSPITPPGTNDSTPSSEATIQKLQKAIFEYKNQARLQRVHFENACSTAIRHLTIREAEIASLKRQLRQEGLKPYNETTRPDDLFWEKELGMMFRMTCCWSKRFYKFPTVESIPPKLQLGIAEVCEDPKNESFLMNQNQTKYLVVIAIASKFLVEQIFAPYFLDSIAHEVLRSTKTENRNGNAIGQVVEMGNSDKSWDEKLYNAAQQASKQRALAFLDWIQPLMSRPKDNTHHEQTKKQFIGVAQHAARIALEAVKRNAMMHFSFFHFGEKFRGDKMKEVTSDSLGLDIATKATTPIWIELRGSVIRLCILPSTKVIIMDSDSSTHEIEAYKANILLFN